jgi:hypothetical protein
MAPDDIQEVVTQDTLNPANFIPTLNSLIDLQRNKMGSELKISHSEFFYSRNRGNLKAILIYSVEHAEELRIAEDDQNKISGWLSWIPVWLGKLEQTGVDRGAIEADLNSCYNTIIIYYSKYVKAHSSEDASGSAEVEAPQQLRETGDDLTLKFADCLYTTTIKLVALSRVTEEYIVSYEESVVRFLRGTIMHSNDEFRDALEELMKCANRCISANIEKTEFNNALKEIQGQSHSLAERLSNADQIKNKITEIKEPVVKIDKQYQQLCRLIFIHITVRQK